MSDRGPDDATLIPPALVGIGFALVLLGLLWPSDGWKPVAIFGTGMALVCTAIFLMHDPNRP